MDAQQVLSTGQQGLTLLLMVSAPVLLVVLLVGLVVSIFQAATQINEATLSFVPKIVAAVAVLGIAGPWMLSTLVEYLQRTDDVRVGDTVVTSGLGCRFPAGLLIGRVSSVTRRDFGLYQEVEIAPAVDFSRVTEVLILATPPTDCNPGVAPTPRRPGARP